MPSFTISDELAAGRLVQLAGSEHVASGTWTVQSLPPDRVAAVARELVRFAQTPRAIQAMLKGSGVNVSRFQPRAHITLWS